MRKALVLAVTLLGLSTPGSPVDESLKRPLLTRNNSGVVKSAEFPDDIDGSLVPKSSGAFFKSHLRITPADEFRKQPQKQRTRGQQSEHFAQYYKGVKVEDGGYNFHYRDGRLFYAHGNYVRIGELDVRPSITPEEARDCFAAHKSIASDRVSGFFSELVVKEIPADEDAASGGTPTLVYRIFLHADGPDNDEFGFVDAGGCRVLLTEPAQAGLSATGRFETLYSGVQYGVIEESPEGYRLADFTRGGGIHVWDINRSQSIYDRTELTDPDTNWTAAEHHASEDDMGQDAHWALQQIYDYLENVHGIDSIDDAGRAITAYIHDWNPDQAHWDMYHHAMFLGDGDTVFRPLATLDVIAHELGHGISDTKIGWPYSGEGRMALHEGMSDIWAVIFENRIRPYDIWKIGERVEKNYDCRRNIREPNSPGAHIRIASTYLSSQYNAGDPHVRGGVLSRWFYLLVNGGQGTNDLGASYLVYPMGMDVAEELIVKAAYEGYLYGQASYPDARTGMVNAAIAMTAPNSMLVRQVENAWYAVGVGAASAQPVVSGPGAVCASGTPYSVANRPSDASITWGQGSGITRVSAQGSNPSTFRQTTSGASWIQASLVSPYATMVLPQKNVWKGPPVVTAVEGETYAQTQWGYFYSVRPSSWGCAPDAYSWSISPPDQATLIAPNEMAFVMYNSPGFFQVAASVHNSCGWSNTGYAFVNAHSGY